MSKVISSLLVGIGFDLDDKSADKIGSSIDGIKSKALRLGGVVAGAFGIKALTGDFAEAKDSLGKFASVFGVTADRLNSLGHALTLEDGTLEGLMSQLQAIEKFRAGLLVGDIGFLAKAEKAGIDTTGLLKSKDAIEAYLTLADQLKNMTTQGRLNAANAVGIDLASIRLLVKGRAEIEKTMKLQSTRRPITADQLKMAMIYKDEFEKLTQSIGGFSDKISTAVLPSINNVIIGMTGWLTVNKKMIDSGIDSLFESIAGNAVAIGASLAALGGGVALGTAGAAIGGAGGLATKAGAAGLGSMVAKIGGFTKALGAVARSFGLIGLALTGGAAIGTVVSRSLSDDTNNAIGKTIAQVLSFFGNTGARQAIERQPIVINSTIQMDGQVISKKIEKVVGGMADQAIQDMKSTEGG